MNLLYNNNAGVATLTGSTQYAGFQGKRVAFVSTRIAGKDGVSLEVEKWSSVLERMGIECFYIAGECDRPADRRVIIERAHFRHPDILAVTKQSFRKGPRTERLTDRILEIAGSIRIELNNAIRETGVHAIIAENALTIPLNIPLGIAIVQSLHEQRIGCIAHHHDFYWERERYLTSAVDDFIRYAFPPALPYIQHVVINCVAGEEFNRRTGLYYRIIPNVMDFANPPAPADEYASGFREAIGLKQDALLILQPTRVVARKGIEHSIELMRRLANKGAKLVITHASGDEENTYANLLHTLSDLMRVNLVFADKWVADERGTGPDGRMLFTLNDVYQQADLVTFPSDYEGFGNAFLETVYHCRPVVCKRYPVFRREIEPYGFRIIAFDEFLTRDTVNEVNRIISDRQYKHSMVEHNYRIARQCFSYDVLEEELHRILPQTFMQHSC